MELLNGSEAFSAYCEKLQSTSSPEDLLIAVEETTLCRYQDLEEGDFNLQLSAVTQRTTSWE